MKSYENVKVVEYLEPLMSKELLGKFPDNSAFDFDYSQSSIWSPLVTRAYSPANNLEIDYDFLTPTKTLDYEDESFSHKKAIYSMNNNNNNNNKKKKKKLGSTNAYFAVNLSSLKFKIKKKKNNNNKSNKKNAVSEFSPGSSSFNGTCNPVAIKVWNKVLKAASKHFKKKKKNSTAHVRLSNSMANENI